MRRTSFATMHCSLARTLEKIGDWWTPLILRDLFLGLSRFDDLVEDLGASRNLLAARLKTLVAAGLIERRRYQDRPPRYAYHLTPAARELVPVLIALTAWGDRWATPPGGPPILFTHARCGQPLAPRLYCECCGTTVATEDAVWRRGPGSKVARGTRIVGALPNRVALAGDAKGSARRGQ
jgi:DNA-binding HxlR family transcriptional regulator